MNDDLTQKRNGQTIASNGSGGESPENDSTQVQSEETISIPPAEKEAEEENSYTGEVKAIREHKIVIASIAAIVGNGILVVAKLIIGFLSNSIAIILDAVNNATDALSSIITIIGTKLAGRRPTRKHPFGFGRIEYLTSVVIAVIILVAGFLSLRESIDKIIHPAETNYDIATIIVIVLAIAAKIVIGVYLKRRGNTLNSQALVASGIDSDYDAILSAGTLFVAFAQMLFNINIDGVVGLLISLFVLKAGIEVLGDALGPIIGEREDDNTDSEIRAYVRSFPGVLGAYDLILDNFGPNEVIGSIHIEVNDDMTAREIAELTRSMSIGLYKKYGVIMTIGVYAANTTGEFAQMHEDLKKVVSREPKILQVHGFYVDAESKTMYFDLVIDFEAHEEAIKDAVIREMRALYPDYSLDVIVDVDFEGDSSKPE